MENATFLRTDSRVKEAPGKLWQWLPLAALCLALTGCRSFLAEHVIKSYPAKVKPEAGFNPTNDYQRDFVYLKNLGEQVVPLENHYFPPAKRAAMEKEIFEELGQPGCTHDTFVRCLNRYLAGFNNEHAGIVHNPRPAHFNDGLYPFKVYYTSNDCDELYVSDIGHGYDHSLIGQRIIAIDGRPIADVEQKLLEYHGAENSWTKRVSLEPLGYSRPRAYYLAGLANSASNQLRLEFAGHAPAVFAPIWTNETNWERTNPAPNLVTARFGHLYDYRAFPEQHFAYFQFNSCLDKAAMLDGLSMVNPWLRPLVRVWLAFEFHEKRPNAFLAGIYDPQRPYLRDYLTTSIRDMNQRGITNLILDLRHNPGGDTDLDAQFLYFLTRRNDVRNYRDFHYNPDLYMYYNPDDTRFMAWYRQKFGNKPAHGQLLPAPENDDPIFSDITDRKSLFYVPTNRPVFSGQIVVLANEGTDSAASLLAGLIQDNHLAVIVGTPTGNNPTGPSEMTPLRLPHSGIVITLPSEYLERANPTYGEALRPDYWVRDSLADRDTGRDAAFEKALEILHLGGALSTARVCSAEKFLKDLKQSGQQPGWKKSEHGGIGLETYSTNAITFRTWKAGGSSFYFYTVEPGTKGGDWKLMKAWRMDKTPKSQAPSIREIPISKNQ